MIWMDEDVFPFILQRAGGYRAEPVNTSEVLMRSLLAGRREIREIPLRTILPQSPPPSPTRILQQLHLQYPFSKETSNVDRKCLKDPTDLDVFLHS